MKRQNMQENLDYCKECKKEWEDAKPYNRWPVVVSLSKESPLRREYPLIVPSTNPKKDYNSNNYLPINEFSIRFGDIYPRKD